MRQEKQASSDVRWAATSLLARRDFASGELRERLQAKGFEPRSVEQLLVELIAAGTLDDARYAQNYVSYHAGRGQGPVRIGAQLRRAGLEAAVIDTALAEGPDWRALALRVRRGKFGSAAPRSWGEKARQARFLQYRGFSADDIRAATGADPDLD
jgi:regulatory protein